MRMCEGYTDLRRYDVIYDGLLLNVVRYHKIGNEWWVVARGSQGETRRYCARLCCYYYMERDGRKIYKFWTYIRRVLHFYAKLIEIQNGGMMVVIQSEE